MKFIEYSRGNSINRNFIVVIFCILAVLFSTASFAFASDLSENVTVESDNQDVMAVADIQQDVLEEGESSFAQLDEVIQNESVPQGGLIELKTNYTFSDSDNATVGNAGIAIAKDVTVDGKGYTLDGSSKASIFKISGDSHVILKNIVFVNANGTDGGAIYVESGSTIEIINCTFLDNFASNNGGAIFIADSLTSTSLGHHSTIENSIFRDCYARGNGGAIYWEGDYGSIIGSRFEHNWVSGYLNSSRQVTYFNPNTGIDEIHYDIIGGDGGAIIWKGSDALIEDTTFYDNYAPYRGGAIFFTGMGNENCTNVTIKKVNFTQNHAAMNGGAIDWAKGASNANISSSFFISNTAGRSAGAIYVSGNEFNVKDTEFNYNKVTGETKYDNRTGVSNYTSIGGNGGAICWMGSYGTVENVTFLNNTATQRGGAIQFERNRNGTVKDSRFIKNTAGTEGGAIDWYQGAINGMIISSEFTDNTAYDNGGAVYIEGEDCKVYDSTFTRNTADENGGAAYVVGDNVQIMNCDFTDSKGDDGGALFVNGTGCLLYNTTFTGNVANDDGGAIYWEGDNGEMYNITCTDNKGVSFNTSSSRGGTICLTGDNVTVSKSLFNISSVNIAAGRDSSKVDGGALFITGNNIRIIETDFIDCNAVNYGGAVHIIGNDTHLLSCNFNNTKALVGGAVSVAGNDAVVDKSVFRHNDAAGRTLADGGTAGAIYVEGEGAIISNSDFAFDTAVRYGGAISVWGPNSIITNNTFDNSSTTLYHGGAIFVNGLNATISLSNFTRCKAENTYACGGAIEVSGGGSNIIGCNFDDCYAYYGGDIHINGADAVIDESNFEHNGIYKNKAPYWGGAVYVNGTNTHILKSNFSDFTAEQYGGAIYVAGTNANISQSSFTDCNVKSNDGGAIYIAGKDTSIEESNFTSCKAENTASHGGAIYIWGENTDIKDSNFDGCVAKNGGDIYVFGNYARIEDSTFNVSSANYGGAIYLDAWGAVVKGSNITECNATYSGGAIYVAGGGTNIIDSSFEDCLAKGTTSAQGGAAIFVYGPDTHISSSEFNNNKVSGSARGGTIYIVGERTILDGSYFNQSSANEGGIIYIEGKEAVIDSSIFANSSSNVYGGAISVHGHNATIRGSSFENINCYRGSGTSNGGAIYVDGSDTDILNSTFDNCAAKSNGGAIYINNVRTTVAFSNFTLSHASTGGAIFISGDNTTVTYCNLNNNTASSTAGAIQISGTNTLISNSNLNYNIAKTAGAIKVTGSNTLISDCNLTYNNATGTGNNEGSGGAMDLSGKNASVRFSWFDHNDAKAYGGAINWDGGHGEDSIIGTTFTNNGSHGTALGGGAIYWTAGKTQIGSGGLIKDSIFINNTAHGHHGGAIDWFHALNSTIDNCLFINNTANSDGGALYTGDKNGNSNNFTISNSQFYNNTAGKHGGAIANQMTNCLIYNNDFDGNKAGSSGGTILMKEAGGKNSVIDHCYISNSFCNKADSWGESGGAIHIGPSDVNVTISNCAIINSTCNQSYGGAVSVRSKDSSLINVTIQNVQTRDGPGGAIHWSGSNAIINNVTIFNSSSHATSGARAADGGAIHLSGSNCIVNNITIEYASSNIESYTIGKSDYGGAIFVSGGDNVLTNIVIDQSNASSVLMNTRGGAIYWSGASGTLINATISNSLANGQGGAIYWSGNAPTVENISIEYSQTKVVDSSNSADGGAIYSTSIDDLNNVYITNAIASTNYGDVYGGAIYYTGTRMNNITVIGSRASTDEGISYGGAVYWKSSGTGYLSNSTFKENTANFGGALFSDRTIYIDNTAFTGNVALDGGALYLRTGDGILNKTIFELNSAKRGGAIFSEKVNFRIDGSNFKNNTAEEKGGAIYRNYINQNQQTYIRNTDLVNNTAFQGSAIYATKFFELTNVVLLDNQANSKEFIDKHVGVDETGNNYTSAVFVGFDNVLNAMWIEENTISIACTNVTYWGVNGRNVSNSKPNRSDREVWQNVTIEIFNEDGEKINETRVVTDAFGRFKYIFNATKGETYYFAFTHYTDRYYTYLRDTLSNRSLVKVYVYPIIYYNQNQSLLISLTDGAWGDLNGTVTVNVTGAVNTTFEIEIINGTYSRSNISGLPIGDYNVSASFAGDINHTGDSDWAAFKVLPYDDLHITKDVNITADIVNVTDIIKYTVNVTNHGPSNAKGVNVTERLSSYLKLLDNQTTRGEYYADEGYWYIGDLEVNETVTLTIIAQIVHMGPITNTVWVTGEGADTNLTNNVASAHNFTAVPILDLRIEKEVNAEGIVHVLDIIKFTVTVFNDGPCNATGVVVGEVLDHHLRLISNETTVGDFSNGTWNIGRLDNGTNATLTIVAQIVYSGNITNSVNVTGFENETNYTNNYASIKNLTAIANVDVGIIKTVNVTGFVNVTDYIQFNITVYNKGPCNATGIFVDEALDYAHLEIISNKTTQGGYDGYSWVIGILDKGESANLTIIAKVIAAGTFGNAVSVECYDNDTNISNNNASIDNITALPIVDLAITKHVDFGSGVVNVSDLIQFTIDVTNNGPCDATNVTVVERLSPLLNMTKCSVYGGSYNVTSGIWYIGNLTNKGVAQLIIQARVISNGTISNFVAVNSTENDTNKSNNNDTIDNITALPVVDLNITKTVSAAAVNVTDIIEFIITVYNKGPSNATDVKVSEILSSCLKLVSNVTDYGYYNRTTGIWHIGKLTNGSTAVLTLVCNVTGNGTIVNYVNVTSHENDTDTTNNEASVTFVARPLVDVSITKKANVTQNLYFGDKIEFTITVHNSGPSNATGVFVTEILDTSHLKLISYNATKGRYDNFTWTIGKLNNGSSENLTLIVEIIALGNISNFVNVTSYENDTDMSNNYANVTNITATSIVDLEITKIVNFGSGVVYVGDLVQFEINVKNNGPCDATDVNVTEKLSPLLRMTTHLVYGGDYNVTSGIWYIGNLANKGVAQLIIQARVISNGTISNFVAITCNETDTNKSNNNDTIDNITALPIVDLSIMKEVNESFVNVTDKIKFTITVHNAGPSNATNVKVSEVLSSSLKLISNVTDYGYYNKTAGVWYIGKLTNGSTAVLTLVCEVTSDGIIDNYVNVTSNEKDTNTINNEWSVSFIAYRIVDVSITKMVNVTPNVVFFGDKIKFTITVHNSGPCNATSVYVEEILDNLHLRMISYNASRGSYDNFTWMIGDLNNGSSENLTIVAQVIALGNFSNVVSVTPYQNDTNMSNNHANVTITALPIADLAITKHVDFGSGVVNVSDVVQFTINVVNNGPCDATNVTVIEKLSPLLNMTACLVYGGKYNVTSGVWYIGNMQNKGFAQLIIQAVVISNGTISNFVAVTGNEADKNKSNNNDTIDNITALPLVDLNITKTVSAAVVNVTDRIEFVITVWNNGPSNATHVNVSEVISKNLRMVSNVTSHGHYDNTTNIWYIGDLTNRTKATLTIVCDVVREGIILNAVNVTSHENDSNIYNNHYEITFRALPIVDVMIDKVANVSGLVNVSDIIEFTITVHNDGPCNATSVFVNETLDKSYLELISYNVTKGNYNGERWFIGDMNNGTTEVMTIVAKVISDGIIYNFANVSSYQNDTDMSNNYANVTITTSPVVDLTITKHVDLGSGVVNVSDIVQFTITVVNNGPCDATNVTVIERLSPLLNMTTYLVYGGDYNVTSGIWYIGDIPNKGFAQLTIQAVVISNGTISNFVAVNSTEPDTNESNNNDTIDNITALPLVDLNITKTVSAAVVNVTDRIEFVITVWNNGPSNATHVNVSEVISKNLRIVSNVTSHGYYDNTTNVWYIGDLTNHTNATLTIICDVVREGIILNAVNVTSHENDSNIYNNHYEISFRALPIVDVMIDKVSNVSGFVNVSDKILFTITVHNDGPCNATSVFVNETLDKSYFELISYNVSKGNYNGERWFIGDMNNGTTEVMTIIAKVISDGSISNFANVSSYQNDTDMSNNYANVTNITALPVVDIAITKQVDFGSGTVYVGDLVQFTINVVNNGPSTATNVTVVEKLSEHLNMTTHLIYGGEYNVTTGIWYIGSLPDKGFAQLIIQAKVISNGTISNFVAVNSTEPDTNKSNNNDTIDNITALPVVDLHIIKTVNESIVVIGDIIKFDITVINHGPSNATKVNVSEVLDDNFRLISNTTTAGYYNKTGGYWYIGDMANHTNETLTLICELMADGTFDNYVNVTGHEKDSNEYNNWYRVYVSTSPIVDVSITKKVNITSHSVSVGDKIEFNITVHNAGPSNATSVLVAESIKHPLRMISNKTTKGAYDGFTWNVGNLTVNETAVLTIVCEVMYVGNISNFVNVTGYPQNDTNESNNRDNITNITAYINVDVGVIKTVNVSRFVNVTDLIRFNITVFNKGPCNATSVSLKESLDTSHLELISYNVTRGTYNGENWFIDRLNKGETVNMTIVAKVIAVGTFGNVVSVSSYEKNDTNTSNNNASIDNITALPIVDLNITKRIDFGNGTVEVGDLVQFTIDVWNRGPSPATNVTVVEKLSEHLNMTIYSIYGGEYNVTSGIWYIGNLSVKEHAQLIIQARVISNGTISNYVVVSSTENDTNKSNNNDTIDNITAIPVVNLIINKDVNVSGFVNVTDKIKFTITVYNAGPSNATNVNVTEELSSHLEMLSNTTEHGYYNKTAKTWYIGKLNNNETAVLTIICKVISNGTISNVVVVNSTEKEKYPENNTSAIDNITALPIVDLNITKTVNVTVGYVGEYIKYIINITNHGPSNATDVRGVDKLSDLLKFIGFVASRDDITYDAKSGNFTVGRLNVNETVILNITAKIRYGGTIPNFINVTSHENDTNLTNNNDTSDNVTAIPVVNMTIVKEVNVTVAYVGDYIKYTISITNIGLSNATDVCGVDRLDDLLEFKGFVASRDDITYDNLTGNYVIGGLAVNETVVLNITAKIKANGTIPNVVNVTCHEDDTVWENSSDNVTALPVVVLTVVKVVDVTVAYVGDNITYTINITNIGLSNATDVHGVDKLDDLLEFVGFNASRGDITYDSLSGNYTVGRLAVNESVVLNITAKIKSNGTIPNVVNVTSHENRTVWDNSSDNVTAIPVVVLSIDKKVNVTVAYVGDLIKYTINITNIGLSNATDVHGVDKLDDLLEFVRFVASRDDITYDSLSGNYSVGRLAVNESVVLNITAKIRANGTIANVVNVTSYENDTVWDNSSDNVTAIPVVVLSIDKKVNVTVAYVGDLIKYTINITNIGLSNATDVHGVDKLDNLLEFIGFVASRDDIIYDGVSGNYTVGKLAVNESVVLNITAKIKANGTIANVVNVTSYENETVWDNSSDNVTAIPVVVLSIDKVVNVTVAYVGDSIKYTINITNIGLSNATDVHGVDKLDDLLEFIGFVASRDDITYDGLSGNYTVGKLAVNESVVLNITAKIRANGTIPNVVNVTSYENETVWDNSSDNVTAEPVVILTIDKKVNVTVAYVGDSIKYTINITNIGLSNATDVHGVDRLDGLLEFIGFVASRDDITYDGLSGNYTVGKLAVNESVVLNITAKIRANGTIANVVNVTSYENETVWDNSSDNVTAEPVVILSIVKVVDVTVAYVGDNITYTINITNIGLSNATDVHGVDKLDDLLEFIGFVASRDDITYDSLSGNYTVGKLAVNESVVLNITAKIRANGTIPNVVNVTSHENKTVWDNSSDNVTAKPFVNLTIDKRVDVTVAYVGDNITYTINITNIGLSNATDVHGVDKLDDLLEFVGFVASRPDITYDSVSGNYVVGRLAVNESVILNITAKIKSNGTIPNIVNVTCDENKTEKNDTSDNVTANPKVNLTIDKRVNVTVAYVGDSIKYIITITNDGLSNATDVHGVDKLDGLLEFVGFVASRPDITYDSVSGNYVVGKLAVNESVVLNITAKIRADGIIPNIVNVTCDENKTDKNDTSDNVTANPKVNLTIDKRVNVTVAYVGDSIKYIINITNIGLSNATDVHGVDKLDGLLEFVGFAASRPDITYDSVSGNYVVGKLAVNESVVLNITAKIKSNGTISNVVNVTSHENKTEKNATSKNVTANPKVNLTITKTVNITSATIGDLILYTITVYNDGPSNATNVNVTEKLSNKLELVAVNATHGYYSEREGKWYIFTLVNKTEAVLNLTVRAKEYGIVENIAFVNSTENETVKNATSDNVTVKKLDTPISLKTYDIDYGETENLVVTLPKEVKGYVNITVNGRLYDHIPIDNGKVELPLSNLAGGKYHVDVNYSGDGKYPANSTSGDFTVRPIVPTIKIEVVDIWHGEVEILNVTVNAPGTVNITVYGKTVEIPLNHAIRYTNVLKASKLNYDGKATWVLIGLPVGTYPAFAVYNGNENYTSVNTSDVFHVRDKPTTITVSAEDIYVGEVAVIHVQLTPKAATGKVTLNIEGKDYNVKLDRNGRATVRVPGLSAGLKHVHVKYDGNILYRPSENETTFNVLKLEPPVVIDSPDIKVGEDGIITVYVPEDATGMITIEIGGKTYTQPVENGKAIFVVPGLEAGLHDISAQYSGDGKYLPGNATGDINVSPINGTDKNGTVENHTAEKEDASVNAAKTGLAQYETGNPIFMLLMVILAIVAIPLRRFKR